MSNNLRAVLFLCALVALVWLMRAPTFHTVAARDVVPQLEDIDHEALMSDPSDPLSENTLNDPKPIEKPVVPLTPSKPDQLPPPVNPELAAAAFGSALQAMTSCLKLPAAGGGSADPTLDNWVNAVRSELGEPVIQTEDWNNIEIRTAAGETRIIRVEMDYSGEERIVRRLSYTKFGPQGKSEEIPLDTQQTEDPSETFIASLEGDGQVVAREKSQRIYFGTGEEIVVTEKNGRVTEIEMSRNGRNFKCTGADTSARCQCQ